MTAPVSQPLDVLINASIVFLKRYPPFDAMDDVALRYLASHLRLAYYPQGSVLLAPETGAPDVLLIVQRGLVQLRPAEGYHVFASDVVTLGPGECFSVYALMEKRAVGSPYTAAADTFCYQLPAEIFTELLHRNPRFQEFSTNYLRSLLKDSRRLIRMHSASAAEEQQVMNRPLRDLLKGPPVTCHADTALDAALRLMHEQRVGSVVITDDADAVVGIFTRHDVLDRVTLAGVPLHTPVRAVMTPDPLTLPAQASAYDAVLLIAERGFRHVPITEQGKLIGIVSERDLFAVQRVSVRGINRIIAQAATSEALEQAGRDVRALARRLLAQGAAAEQLTQLMTALNDALTQRVIALTQRKVDLQGLRWCWLSFGSEGRQEQTISTDQDNGLIFDAEANVDMEQTQAKLLRFAVEVNTLLDRCGFPLCKGGIMAGNPQWCLSLEAWRQRFDSWVGNTDEQALLKSVIFFDFRPLAGESALADALQVHLQKLVKGNACFQRQLAVYALKSKPPLGLLSDFVTEDVEGAPASVDLKGAAARLFVDAARILALAAGVSATNTAQRLREASVLLGMPSDEIAAMVDAFYFVQQLRLRVQLAMDQRTHASANRIAPADLNEIDRRILKESLRQARKLQSRLALDYQL